LFSGLSRLMLPAHTLTRSFVGYIGEADAMATV